MARRPAAGKRPRDTGASVLRGLSRAFVLLWIVIASASASPPDPDRTLVVAPGLVARLQLLAGGLKTEIVLCLTGRSDGAVWVAEDFFMPRPLESAPNRARFETCPSDAVAVWHNHLPPGGIDPVDGIRGPRSSKAVEPRTQCALSRVDLESADRLGTPFFVVSVDSETWCWWSLSQVRQFLTLGLSPGPAPPGQLHAASLRSTSAPPPEQPATASN